VNPFTQSIQPSLHPSSSADKTINSFTAARTAGNTKWWNFSLCAVEEQSTYAGSIPGNDPALCKKQDRAPSALLKDKG